MSSQRRGGPSFFVFFVILSTFLATMIGNASYAHAAPPAGMGSLHWTWVGATGVGGDQKGDCATNSARTICMYSTTSGITATVVPSSAVNLQMLRVCPGGNVWGPTGSKSGASIAFAADCTEVYLTEDGGSNGSDYGFRQRRIADGDPAWQAPPLAPPNVTAGNCILTEIQLAGVARSVGFTNSDIQIAVAVVLSESNGKVNAVTPVTGPPPSYDIGLFQINDLSHSAYNRDTLGTNPTYNMAGAFELFTAGGWNVFPNYANGQYSNFLGRATAGVNGSGGAELPLGNCSGGMVDPNDPDGTGTIGNNPDDNGSDNSCGFSLNPFKAIKCAFVPSDGALDGWQELKTNAEERPPLSLLQDTVDYFGTVVSGYTDDCIPGSESNDCSFAPGSQIGRDCELLEENCQWFNPISALDSITDADNGWTEYAVPLIRVALWLAFFFYAYKRITSSFGGKENV